MEIDHALPSHAAQADLSGLARPLVDAMAMQLLSMCNSAAVIAAASPRSFPVLYANPAFCALMGADQAALLGRSLPTLDPETETALSDAMVAVADGRGEQRQTLRSSLQGGAPALIDWQVTPAYDREGAVSHLLCLVGHDSEQRQQHERLLHMSTHDSVTGLGHRSLFDQQLRDAIAQAAASGRSVAVLCLALDGFSLANDTFGDEAGDQLLAKVAQRLKGCVQEGDALTRHGADQFLIMLDRAGNQNELSTVCEQLLRIMDAPFTVEGRVLQAGCSLGLARYPDDSGEQRTLLHYAEIAMAAAQSQGGKRYRFFNAAMGARIAARAHMVEALHLALAADQLHLQYQPVADLREGGVCAVEALVRWNHPDMGLIEAGQFIPLAEETGLNTAIGQWTLQRAVRDMQAWRAAGLAPVSVAINLSPKQFRDPGLAAALGAALSGSGIDPAQLSLEFTEDALLLDADAATATLARCKALGVGLTLDDFGNGFSSLNHLKRFPFDQVKIDSALMADVVTSAGQGALVKTIISMAHHLGMRATAKGVETEAQCDFVRRHLCDRLQGYFFGAPCDAARIGELLGAGHALPAHLLHIQLQPQRTLLLVDDEHNILSSLRRLLRSDGYRILCAANGDEGLAVLAANEVDVIVSDQRMPGMIGADFLRAAKSLYPETIRIMLSGYTELQSVTDAVNEGAIFKFLTKPWDDVQLRNHIAEAFRMKDIADDNERLNLALRSANQEMAATNRRMETLLQEKQQQITRDEISLNVARDLLQCIPLAVIGIDDDGMVAFVNGAAATLFGQNGSLLGNQASVVLPELFSPGASTAGSGLGINGRHYQVSVHPMGQRSQSRGSLVTLHLNEEPV